MCKKHKDASDTIITIIDIIIPFFTKSINLNSTSIFFKIDIHIIPASAPIGVRSVSFTHLRAPETHH